MSQTSDDTYALDTSHSAGRSIFIIFPLELVERILIFCHPWDVATFTRTCRAAHTIVYRTDDQHLWRELFLSYPFDDLRESWHIHHKSNSASVIDWQRELTQRMRAELVISNAGGSTYDKIRSLETLISVVQRLPPATLPEVATLSHDINWITRLLQESHILDSQAKIAAEPYHSLVFAQLKSYVALSLGDNTGRKAEARLRKIRGMSRSFVYDLRHYTSSNSWGPYLNDGNINWIHIESLINVVLLNLRELPAPWCDIRPPTGLQATRAYSAPGASRLSKDWAGVEGTWRRYVGVTLFSDLFAFNHSDVFDGDSQNVSLFEDPRFREATRLIEVKLALIPPEKLRFRQPLKKSTLSKSVGVEDPYPPLYFSGMSRGVDGNEALMEGVVHMSHSGIVRWQFVSVYAGNIQWSSDGAQVGNVASALGVVGVWTTAFHELGDPVGPFWLWKVEDNYPTHPMIDS